MWDHVTSPSGYGNLYFCKFSYNPVSGDRKSGIPAIFTLSNHSRVCMQGNLLPLVDIPAPVSNIICFGSVRI